MAMYGGYGPYDPYSDPYYDPMPPMPPEQMYPVPPVPPPPQPRPPPPPLVSMRSPMDYGYPAEYYSRSAYPASRTLTRQGPAAAMPPSMPMQMPPQPQYGPPRQTVIERQFAGVVGRDQVGGVRFDDDDEVILYPAKKSKSQMWRKVKAKKIKPEPENRNARGRGYYDGPVVEPPYIPYGPPPQMVGYRRYP